MSSRVVVTGAAGLIGSAVVESLAGCGARAVGLTRRECDVADRESVRAALAAHRPSAVVHTAYLLADRSSIDHREAVSVNVAGFLNILEESLEAGVESFVYASSIAVYDACERSDLASTAPPSVYGAMKLVNERQAAAVGGFRRLCGVRIANVYADVLGRGQTGWVSTAVRDALAGLPARVELAPDALMAIMWRGDIGERLAALVLSDPDVEWPAVVDGGGERVTGATLAAALARAGAPAVNLGDERYDYPSTVPSAWLDSLVGSGPVPVASVLERLGATRR